MLHWTINAFSAPRKGYDEREYEDAWDRYPKAQESGAYLRVAVADGATASSFAREWSEMLARAFVHRRFVTAGGLRRAVTDAAPFWWRMVLARPLPWYAEEKARRGAFTSFVGLHLTGGERSPGPSGEIVQSGAGYGVWQALAVGDSCLFHIRADALLSAFPLQHSEQFTDSPALISSHLARNSQAKIVTVSGQWRPGDVFILATDALAAWFLAAVDQGDQPWRSLAALSTHAFRAWLDEMRASGHVRNDDATCIIIQLPTGAESDVG